MTEFLLKSRTTTQSGASDGDVRITTINGNAEYHINENGKWNLAVDRATALAFGIAFVISDADGELSEDQSRCGSISFANQTDDRTYTLNSAVVARHMAIEADGTVLPNISPTAIFLNNTTAYSITLKYHSGDTGVTLLAGKKMIAAVLPPYQIIQSFYVYP